MDVEDPTCHVEQLEQLRVRDTIEDRRGLSLRGHDVGGAQHREMLGYRRARAVRRVLQLADAHGAIPQQLQDVDALRMARARKNAALKTRRPTASSPRRLVMVMAQA